MVTKGSICREGMNVHVLVILELEEQLQLVYLSLDREMMHRYESCLLCVCCRYIKCICVGTSFFVFFL